MMEEVENNEFSINSPGLFQNATTLNEKLNFVKPPVFDLEPVVYEAKFLGRYRLLITNLSNSVSAEDLEEIFGVYGETTDVFVDNHDNYGYIIMDYYHNAAKAKRELNGAVVKNRNIFVRYSPQASIKVKNLSNSVTNEYLHLAFSIFGDVEYACVLTHADGTRTGEGIVDFVLNSSALSAIVHCSINMFFLTASLLPVQVEEYIPTFDLDGISEANIVKTNNYFWDRTVGPRFSGPRNPFFQTEF